MTAPVTPPAGTTVETTVASIAGDDSSVVTKTRTKIKIVKDQAEVAPVSKGKGGKVVVSETVTETDTEIVSKKKGNSKTPKASSDAPVATTTDPVTPTGPVATTPVTGAPEAPTTPTTPTKPGKGTKGKPKPNPIAGTTGEPTAPAAPSAPTTPIAGGTADNPAAPTTPTNPVAPTGPASPGGGPARTNPIRMSNAVTTGDAVTTAEATGHVPANFAFPEVNRIQVKTDLYSAQLKTLEEYPFDRVKSLGAKAKETIEKQKALLAETKKMQGVDAAKPITEQQHLDHLKQMQDSQKNFAQIEKNNKEILGYIQKDGGKITLPTAPYAYTSRYQYLLYLQRSRLIKVGGSASGNIATMNVYGMNNEQIETAAKASNMTAVAYKANYLNQKKNNDDLATVNEMTQKLGSGKTLTAEDIKKLPEGVTIDQLQNHLREMQAAASANSTRAPSGEETGPQ